MFCKYSGWVGLDSTRSKVDHSGVILEELAPIVGDRNGNGIRVFRVLQP